MNRNNFKEILGQILHSFRKLQSNRYFGKVLIFFSFAYPIILIGISWRDLIELNLELIVTPFLLSLLLSSLSLILQSLNWTFIVNNNFSDIKLDLEIYFKTVLMRKLPGGFWHWIGRANLYSNSLQKSGKFTGVANIKEFFLLVFTGLFLYLTINFTILGIIAFIVFFFLILFVNYFEKKIVYSDLPYSFLLIVSYVICWILGGGILKILINFLVPNVQMALTNSTSIWTLTGTVGTIFFFLPSIFFIRELTLTALLSPYMVFSKIILLSLILRLSLTIADVFVASLGLIGLNLFKKKFNQKF